MQPLPIRSKPGLGYAWIRPGAHTGPAAIQPARPEARQAARASTGRSHLPLVKRRLAEAERRRGGCSLSLPPGKARVGPGAHSGGVGPRFSLCCRGRARRHGRRKAEAERRRGAVSPYQSKAGSGREPTRVGSSPGSACASEGAQCCKGVAGPKPRDAGEGAASPYWVKPGSGWEPTRVGSSPNSACAAKGAPGCMGVAGPKPSYAGEGAASPHKAKACSGLEPTQVAPGPDSACSAQGAPACEGKGCATQGREQCLLQGEALFWQRAHMCGVQPSAGLCARRRARLRRRWARAKQCRAGPGGYSHSPQGEASVGRVPT